MNVYWFEIEVSGPVTEDNVESLAKRVSGDGGIDATVQGDRRGGAVMFSREADDAVQAVVSAVKDVESAGMTPVGVTEDRVTVDEIAERAGRTATTVRYWIAGERGPGGFPEPVVERQRSSEWSWAEVAAWLSAAKIGRVDHIAAETARVCVLVNSALAVRRGIRELPKRDRPLITDLVA